MTPTEFKAIRVGMGLTQAELATLLGYSHRIRVTAFESTGKVNAPIPPLLDRLMRAYEAGYRPPGHADTLSRKAPQRRKMSSA